MTVDQKVSDAVLQGVENALTVKFDSVKDKLKRLQATIDSLEGNWQGIGANHFNKKQTEINNRMVGLGHQLLSFQESIKAARTISGDNEDAVRQALQGVDVVPGYTPPPKSSLNDF
ncbi:WXG100 family type VII secretion target [Streptomyces californicus]|uniref:WXG100 family type VII secretion target n=1 Tax=Streptomyces californicus TaxID=67351 RepID=UPI0037A9273D